MKPSLLALLTLLVSGASLSAQDMGPKATDQLIATTYGGSSLHKVSSDGKITPFKMPPDTRWGSGGPEGSDDPLPSADGKLIASVQDGSLLIRPMAGGKSTTVISGYRAEILLITCWSPDSNQLVYYLGPPQADDAPPSKITEPKQFVYDRQAAASRELKVNGSFCGWLPDGTMLIQNGEAGTLNSVSVKQSTKPKLLLKNTDGYEQIFLHPDGKRIAINRSKPNNTSNSQLMAVELDGGKTTALSPPGDWAQYQWPKWSPSGKRIAWITRVGMKDSRPRSVLTVDGKDITKATELSDFHWLNETTVALVELESLVVLDLTTGKELGRKKTATNAP